MDSLAHWIFTTGLLAFGFVWFLLARQESEDKIKQIIAALLSFLVTALGLSQVAFLLGVRG